MPFAKRSTPGAGSALARHTLGVIDELGVYVREQARYDEAEALFREALAGRRKVLSDSHPDVARSLRSLGILKRRTGEPDEAERFFREALAIDRASLPARSAETAWVLRNPGALLNERGRPTEAEPLLREALSTDSAVLRPGHHEVAAVRRDLGYSLALQARYPEAERLLLGAHRDLARGRDYWSRREERESLRCLVGLYPRSGRPAEAATYQRLLASSGS